MKRTALISALAVLICLPALSQNPSFYDLFIAEGSMEFVRIQSQALENNFLGDNSDRELSIYLPPGYEQTPDNHYPVIYLLHGYTGNHNSYFYNMMYEFNLKFMLDTLINSNTLTPVIVVCPNAHNSYKGSWYANSYVTGNWEDFITNDLVEYMDHHYRTLAGPGGRGICGHSMGGYGSFKIGMKHPGIFAATYPMSGVLDLGVHLTKNKGKVLSATESVNFNQAEMLVKLMISEAAAFAPDSSRKPFYGGYPLDVNGMFIDSIWTRWMEHDPFSMLADYKDSIAKLRAIQFDCGISDFDIYDENVSISGKMTEMGIDHVFLEYEGEHGDKIEERMREHLLPFFSMHLDHGVPGISRISASYLAVSDSLVLEMDEDGMIYLVPKHTVATQESIQKSQLASMPCEPFSKTSFPLAELGKGHYVAYGIGSDSGGISIPLPFVVDSKTAPPELTVLTDTVGKGDSVFVRSDKDAMVYLAVRGTTPEQIPSRRVKAEAEVTAGIIVGLPTAGLGRGEYLLYAKDQAGLISRACQLCIAEPLGLDQLPGAGIRIHPNPTGGHIHIETASPGCFAIEIRSMNGQTLHSSEFMGSNCQIDLSSFKAGTYLVTIRSEGLLYTTKILLLKG